MQNQRAALRKQQEDYVSRAAALKKELKTLKQQRSKLVSLRSPPSPTTNGFIKENDKLQVSSSQPFVLWHFDAFGRRKTKNRYTIIYSKKKKKLPVYYQL
jgi:hypothetical protein